MPRNWESCYRAADRLADMVCAMYHPKDEKARQTWPVSTWAEIIAIELGISHKPTRKPTKYNGHRSWNAWNVSLWIANDEGLYRLALECLRKTNRSIRGNEQAARDFIAQVGSDKTPDGAPWGFQNVRSALLSLLD